MIRRCPEEIRVLFDDERTIARGRYLAVEWAKSQINEMRVGDKMLIPDAATGDLLELEKTDAMQ